MTMKLLVFVVVALSAVAAAAQTPPDVLIPVPPVAQALLPGGGQAPAQFGIVAFEAVDPGSVVLDAPYAAEAVTEITQTLLDGNRIEQRTSAVISRDSRGRIRREQQSLSLGPLLAQTAGPLATITDPAARTLVTLDYKERIARRTSSLAMSRVAARMVMPSENGGSVVPPDEARMFEFRVPPPDAGPDFVAALPVPAPGALVLGPGAVAGARAAGSSGAPLVRTETLHAQLIEGIQVEGTRTTMTIPAGQVGNSQPIDVVSERWYSPELQVVILTRRLDPRFGETTFRLTNIVRAEPAAELFEIPSDFVIQDVRPAAVPGLPAVER